MSRTLVAIATTAERVALLPHSLGSLRPQCDRLHVYLNGHAQVPDVVRELADDWIRSDENEGADRKFRWAHEHDGIYLSCDDDFLYPPDYVARMTGELARWTAELGRALFVTAHGRSYPPRPKDCADRIGASAALNAHCPSGQWVNHAGTGVLAWDAAVIQVPLSYPVRNRSDVQLSAWANARAIPIWTVPHFAGWFKPLRHEGSSVGLESRLERHASTNRLLLEHPEWKIYGPEN